MSGATKVVSGVVVSAAKTMFARKTWTPTAGKTMERISAATTATVFVAPVSARNGRILQRSTAASTASVTTSTVTVLTTSCVEVRTVKMNLDETLVAKPVVTRCLSVLYQDTDAANAGSASATPIILAVPVTARWKRLHASPKTDRSVMVAVPANAVSVNAPTPSSRVQPVSSVPPVLESALSTSESGNQNVKFSDLEGRVYDSIVVDSLIHSPACLSPS